MSKGDVETTTEATARIPDQFTNLVFGTPQLKLDESGQKFIDDSEVGGVLGTAQERFQQGTLVPERTPGSILEQVLTEAGAGPFGTPQPETAAPTFGKGRTSDGRIPGQINLGLGGGTPGLPTDSQPTTGGKGTDTGVQEPAETTPVGGTGQQQLENLAGGTQDIFDQLAGFGDRPLLPQVDPTTGVPAVAGLDRPGALDLEAPIAGIDTTLPEINSQTTQALIDASTANLRENLRRTLPSAGDAALAAGQGGSSRQAIVEAVLSGEAERDISSVTANILAQQQEAQQRRAIAQAQLGLTGRGQDIGQRAGDLQILLNQRGQDLSAILGERGQDITQRGQTLSTQLGERGQDITQRSQDITQQGQNQAALTAALGLAPQLTSVFNAPLQRLLTLGGLEQEFRDTAGRNELDNLLQFANLVQGFIPGSTQTQTSSTDDPNALLRNIIGGGLTAASFFV